MFRGLPPQRHPLDSISHVARQSILGGVAQLAGLFLRLATAVLVARLLGAAALGLYVLTLTLASGAAVMATLGLDRGLAHFIAHHRGRQEPAAVAGVFAFSSAATATAATAAGGLLFVLGPQLALWLHHPELGPATRVTALSVPFLVLGQVARAGLTGLQDVRLAAILEQLTVPLATTVVFLAVHLGRPADVAAPVVAAAVANVGVGLASWLALRARLSSEWAPGSWRPGEWLRFSFPLWLERGLLFVVASAGYGVLAAYGDQGSVGMFGAAVRVAGVVGMPLLAVSAIFGPTISNLAARGEWQVLQVLYARLTWALAGTGGVLGLALAAGSPWVLAAFGPGFGSAWGGLALLAASQVVNSATGPSGLVLIMTGRTGVRLANAAVGAALTVGLSWLAVPRFGAAGAAGAVALSSSILNVVQVHQVRRLVGLWAYARGPALTTSRDAGLGCPAVGRWRLTRTRRST